MPLTPGKVSTLAVSFASLPSGAFVAPHRASRVTTETTDADGVTGVTAASYDGMFSGGDAERGVAALTAAGKVKINDVPVPTVSREGEYSADLYLFLAQGIAAAPSTSIRASA